MWRADIEVPNLPVDVSSWGRSACYPQSTFYPLSDGCSILNHRITISYFRTWSTCLSHSQAPFCYCTLRTVTKRAEGTFESLRYFLGGDHPSQTTHQAMSLFRLEFQYKKGGISTLAPRCLATPLHSFPPILHIQYQNSMLSYSKGSWGLSVPLRVNGIFTVTTISPSSRLRQCPDRYTIRAGRNLPDKEFRYLRTVIVTAAVYWGFDSMLLLRWHPLLTFQHRAGVRPYTSSFDLAKPCVFVKQSPGPILCGLSRRRRLPLSRSYRVNLPSSLAVIHSSALEYSSQSPVSVYGTGY